MIDLHSHILHGLDDGAQDLSESVAMARAAVADGIHAIAATPTSVRTIQRAPTRWSTAFAGCARRSPRRTCRSTFCRDVLPGGEIALNDVQRLAEDDLCRFGLGGNPRYLLLDTPYIGWPLAFGEIVGGLVAAGVTPIVAHPERNAEVQGDPGALQSLVQQGALVQVTAARSTADSTAVCAVAPGSCSSAIPSI